MSTLAEPATRTNMLQSANEPVGGTPERFGKAFREDSEKYGRLVKELNLRSGEWMAVVREIMPL